MKEDKEIKDKSSSGDTEFSLSAVPRSKQRQGVWAAMAVLVGFTFFAPSMNAGGELGVGLALTGLILAIVLGNTFLAVYTGVLAHIGQKTALSYDLLAHHSFGKYGSYLPSAIISFTQAGWFGVGVAMFSIPVAEVLNLPLWTVVAFTGIVMTITAYFGIKSLAVLGSITVPLIFIIGVWSVSTGLSDGGGISQLFSGDPSAPITLAAGIGIVIGSFVSGGTSTPNFARFSRTNLIAVVATVTAFFVGNSMMMIFGAVGGSAYGTPDIFLILQHQGMVGVLLLIPIVVLGFNIWASNNHAIYTAGLGVANITKAPMKPMVLVGGAVGTIASVWLYYNFVTWLTTLGSIIPPIGAVIIVHYFMNKKQYLNAEHEKITVNWGGILAVACGTLVGLFLDWGVAPVNALVVSGVVCAVWELLVNRRKRNAALTKAE